MADTKDTQAKPQSEEHQHIPTEPKQEEEADQGTGGLLSKVGDPIGKVLGTALRPIGAPLEKGVTGPLGNAVGGSTRGALGPMLGGEDQKMEVLGGNNKDSYEKPEKIAGKEQTGENPLGLDQTGRWGFDGDEEKK
ncbi:hypothetical protein P153DRAFT_390168 [Dothidotthia symphoricarpi CBS 119687]|uniref:Uncharacterized protein n=1 Tax=Dothidotthia symphoricarpi CBS 119687 TaxID=1392245 RepID=A0A6A5ZYR7_9PLEO|nr:uncharacterized protein P153DRAFT_390168 [Dothidotthia symphoricarpi CBS 119687]KAF2124699.1 hypothetical protein P153DRAFT_390168 [Dothidotthia symphoricarpi CBS 119687]